MDFAGEERQTALRLRGSVIGKAFFWRNVVEGVFQRLINVSGDHAYSIDPTPP